MSATSRILHVNCRTRQVQETRLPAEKALLGARALTSRMVCELAPPTCDPLGRHNPLIIACGPLAGTLASSVNRLSIGAKSPLTGGIKESNAGGTSAYMLGRLDIRALVLEDTPEEPNTWSVLHVSKDGVRFDDGSDISGLGVFAKATVLFGRYGKHVGMSLIGPVGEMRMTSAGVTNLDPDGDPSRYNGRGGLGAVMGSKGILAVVYDAEGAKAPMVDQKAFNALSKELGQNINSTPQTAETFRKFGTAAMMAVTQSLGALPTRNFTQGRFEGEQAINGKALHDTILARGGEGRISHACMRGCLVQCSNIFPDAQGNKICSPLEYENLGMLGSNLAIGDLDSIARLNWLCNDIGCDTIEMGAALGVAMHAGALSFGDVVAAESALEEVRRGTAFGRVLGAGAGTTARVYGSTHAPVVKNQAMAAYDPRGIKGLGVTYSTSTQGSDHTAGNTIRAAVDHHSKEGQVEASRGSQIVCTLIDSLGCCLFIGAAIKDWGLMCGMLRAKTGVETTFDELKAMACETLRLERDFNRKAGLDESKDCLPEFMYEERNPDSGQVFDLTVEDMRMEF